MFSNICVQTFQLDYCDNTYIKPEHHTQVAGATEMMVTRK